MWLSGRTLACYPQGPEFEMNKSNADKKEWMESYFFPGSSLIKDARDRQHGWKLGKPGSSKDRKQLETPCPPPLHLSA